MSRRRRWVLVIGGFLLVLVVAAAVFAAARRDSAEEVRIEPVAARDLVATVRGSGWIRPRRAVEVQADIMGRIVSLRVREGQAVQRGELLLRLDPSQYEAAVEQAAAAVSAALAREAQTEATLLQAEQAARRARELSSRPDPLISPQTLEDAETQVNVQRALLQGARHDVQRSRAALTEARDRLSKTVIRAPMDGVITRLNVEEGEMAIVGTMNNPGSLLLTISDLSVMEAVVRVDETDVPAIQIGDSASVEIDAFPRQSFAGQVTEIGHSAVQSPGASQAVGSGGQLQAVDFEVVITLDHPPPTLRPDLSANARVITARREQVLAIPIIALTVRETPAPEPLAQEDRRARAAAAAAARQRDEEGVFVVRSGRAEFVPVEVGIAGDEYFEVVAGLAAGDSVVAGPYEAIRELEDGDAVKPLQQQARRRGR